MCLLMFLLESVSSVSLHACLSLNNPFSVPSEVFFIAFIGFSPILWAPVVGTPGDGYLALWQKTPPPVFVAAHLKLECPASFKHSQRALIFQVQECLDFSPFFYF